MSKVPGRPHRLAQHTVGFVIVDEVFFVRVPTQFSLENHGDISQVTDGAGTMADFHRSYRLVPRLDAIEEVSLVVITLV